MTEDEYTMACRYKKAIKRYEDMKLKIRELYGNVKESGTHNKIDGVHALLDALYCFDLSEGLIQV